MSAFRIWRTAANTLQPNRSAIFRRSFRERLLATARAPECLEQRIAPAVSAGNPGSFFDTDGDGFTVKLTGPGSVEVLLDDSDGDGRGPISALQLAGTTAKSKLSVAVKGDGDREVTIGAITGTGDLRSFSAPKSDLVGSGLDVGGSFGSLKLSDVRNGAEITLDGTATNRIALAFGEIGDGSDLTFGATVTKLTALRVGTGEWSAPSFGLIATKSGGFGASVLAAATAEQLGRIPALRALTVVGGDLSGDVNALGNVGTINVKQNKSGGGNIAGATLGAANFKTINVRGDVDSSLLLAGAHLGSDFAVSSDDTYGPGAIGKFNVRGNVTASIVGAGFFPGDSVATLDDDGLLGGSESFIKKFAIKGSASSDSLFAAGLFPARVKIGGESISPLADPRFLTLGTPDQRPPVLRATLVEDTGLSALDRITSNATVSGRVTDNLGAPRLSAAFGSGTPVDISNAIGTDGRFTLDSARLATINGGALPDGAYVLHLQASDVAGNSAQETTISFELDRTAPGVPVFNLSTGSDSGVLGDQLTSAAVVQLTGQADPNAQVLLGNLTALASATGSFVFPDVALNSGDNLLTARVIDVAGNVAESMRTITRSGVLGTDVVLEWNSTNLEAIRMDATTPPAATRGLAMVSGAMFDVVNAFEGSAGFFTTRSAPTGASLEAAVGAAAHDVLVYLFPGQKAFFDATLVTTLGRVPDGAGESSGVSFGAEIATTVIALRTQDGFNSFVEYAPGTNVGDWQQTAPAFDVGLAPQWAQLDPFVMNTSDQFRPPAPPALDSPEYAAAFNDVKALGAATGGTRTPEQTQIARFWSDGAGTYTPAGHWNTIAMELAQANGLSSSANARMLAQLNLAMADAAIACWDAKYFYDSWRPITAIHEAALDGNSQTAPDASWRPLLITPPFPEYTSGHSTFSGAAATVLGAVFGENTSFATSSLGLPGVTRSFTTFDDAASEAGRSRVFGGIHFQFASDAGLAAGHAVADFVLDRFAVEGDVAGPTILAEGMLNGGVTKENFTINGRVLDNISGVASLKAQLDGGTPFDVARDASGAFTFPVVLALDGSADGAHTLTLSALDAVGNASAPKSLAFTLDTRAPALSLASALDGASLVYGSRLGGSADGTGSPIQSVSYAFDGGTSFTVASDPLTGAFESALNLSALAAGAHTLTITATDSAGLTASRTLNVDLASRIPFTINGITPADESVDVGTTFRPQIFFSRPVDAATLNANNFFATGANGEKLPATIVPGADGDFAWLFLADPMPGGANITIHADGATILAAADGAPLDGDLDGTPGGQLEYSFETVSLMPLIGTSLSGRVFDPGVDLKPMTFDDIRAGPDGVLHSSDDVFLNPLAGVKVFILGRESEAVFTDATGAFSFASVPAGNIKLAIDGNTATNEPAGFYFPEMVMDLTLRAGQANTVMGSMGTLDQQLDNAQRREVYLPRLRTEILQPVSDSAVTMVGVNSTSAPNLTEAQRALLQLEVQPGSLVDNNGQPIANGQVGISAVPPALVRDMLPPGVLQHTFDITIQAPGAAVFDTPLEITFPNVFNAAPGTKLNFLSFDHTTGRLVIEGTATVSADGLSATTDPNTGITKPGWHGLTPPGDCAGSGGPPPLPPKPPTPMDTRTENPPVAFSLIGGDGFYRGGADLFSTFKWKAPEPLPNTPPPPPPPPDCPVPPRLPDPEQKQPYLKVIVDVDGPLGDFMRATGNLALTSQSFTLVAGSGEQKELSALGKNYDDMFGVNGFAKLTRDQLYGAKIKITEIHGKADGSKETIVSTYYQYRWIPVVDALDAKAKGGFNASFLRTNTEGFVRTKNVDYHLGATPTHFDGPTITPFDLSGTLVGSGTAVWSFDPFLSGGRSDDFTIRVDDPASANLAAGSITANGTATNPTTINVNLADYKDELGHVLSSLRRVWTPGPDGQPGIAMVNDDGILGTDSLSEYGAPGSDDLFELVYVFDRGDPIVSNFLAGPDGRPGVPGFDDDGDGRIDNSTELGRGGDPFLPVIDPAKAKDANGNRTFIIPGARFRAEFAGFLPGDNFTSAELDALLETKAQDVLRAVKADYAPANVGLEAFKFVESGGDVTMSWDDPYFQDKTLVHGYADGDRASTVLQPLLSDATIPDAAKHWALAEGHNITVSNSGVFGIGLNLAFTAPNLLGVMSANLVSHEIGHTFGLLDSYVFVTAGTGSNVTPPGDIMTTGGRADPDEAFANANVDILRASVGTIKNGDLPLGPALAIVRANFNLANSATGIDIPLDETQLFPNVFVSTTDRDILPNDEFSFVNAVADGPDGSSSAQQFILRNVGHQPLQFANATLERGNAGFSIANPAVLANPLAPGESALLMIQFDPGMTGAAFDRLIINSNAAANPAYAIDLVGSGVANQPLANVNLVTSNNLGGLGMTGGAVQSATVFRITNDGAQPLTLSSFVVSAGADQFSLLGLPADLATNPIRLELGQSFTFGGSFDASALGLQVGEIKIATNDPAAPILSLSLVGTGVDTLLYPEWGNDFVAVDSNSVVRARSNDLGNFDLFLPAESAYETVIFDPETALVAHNFGNTGASGRGIDLTSSLVFDASTEPDSDFDGLPDDIEFAVGTGAGRTDTDADGLSDFVEVLRGLDPLGGRSLPTAVVSAVAMAGEAKEVVAAVLASDPVRQLAFIATGSAGLAIANVTDVNRPTLLGELDLPGDATDVAVDPLFGIAVVATNTGGLHFIDVDDPTRPNLLRTVSGNATQVEVGGGLAVAAGGTTLRAYNILSGDLLQSTAAGSNPVTGLALDGNAIFTMEGGNTLRAFEISGNSVIARDTLVMPVGGGKLSAGNGVAHIAATASGAGGFATASVSDLNNLTLLSGADDNALGGTAFASGGGRFGVSVGHSDFVFGAFRALDLVDISDPANTGNFLTRINLPERPLGVALGNGFAFVADGVAGLQIVNFASPDSQEVAPVVNLTIDALDINPTVPGVQVQEGTAIRLRPVVAEDVQIATVDLLLNGAVLATDIAFPFALSALAPAIATLAGGPNATLQVRATDTGGNTTLSAPALITLVPDTFAPILAGQDPSDGATRTQNFRTITLSFSEPMAAATFSAQSLHLVGPGGEIAPVSVELRSGNQQVRVTYPALPIGNYNVTLDQNEITDAAGNALGAGPVTSGFEVIEATIEWVGSVSSFWDEAANWSTGLLPVATDIVYVPDAASVTHRSGNTVVSGLVDSGTLQLVGGSLSLSNSGRVSGTFALQGGTLTGPGGLNISGTLDWQSGGMSGAGFTTVTTAGDLMISGAGGRTIDARTLNLQGTTVWSGNGSISLQSGATINNSASFLVQGDPGLFNNGGAVGFNNSGTFTKNGGTGLFNDTLPFNNTGSVVVQTGQFRLNGGGTSSSTFSVASGAALEFNSNYTLNTGTAISGAGFTRLTNATTTVAGNVSVENFELAGGTIAGAGTFTVTDQFNWNSGGMGGTGITTIPAGSDLMISGAGGRTIDARTLNLQGTTVWSGNGSISLQSGATINNSASFLVQGDPGLFNNGGAVGFNNSGTFTKNGGTGLFNDTLPFNNTGSVVVQTGQFRLNGGGTSSSTFSVASGAALEFNSNYTLNTGTAISGAGFTRLTNATTTVAGNVSVENFELAGGTIAGAGTFTVTDQFNWNSGGMGGTGITTIPAGSDLMISGAGGRTIDARTLNLQGTTVWSGNGSISLQSGATINNSASFLVQGDPGLFNNGGAVGFNNSGTFTKNGGTGLFNDTLPFNNTGSVVVQTGQFRLNGGGTSSSTFSVASGAALEFNSNYTLNTGTAISGAGFTRLTNATTTVAGNVSVENFELAGGTIAGAGTFTVTDQFNWNSGGMGGTGITTIPAGSDLMISGAGGRTIDARTLNLQGTTVWSGNGSISLQSGATINNSASFLVQGDPGLFNNGGAVGFNNSGTFTKNGGTGLFNDTLPFNNTGSVVVQTGQFRLNGGGTSSSTFSVASGAALEFNSNYTLNTGTAISGAGFTRLTNATTTVAGNVSVENFELAGGTIAGAGTLTVTDQFNWNSGGMGGTGITTIPAGSDLMISGAGGRTIDARTLNLQGNTVWSGNGSISLQNGATINNSASFLVQGDPGLFSNGGAPDFNNSGTFTKNGGTGLLSVTAPFNNTGTIEIVTGTLRLPGGFTNQNVITIGKAAVLDINNGAFTQTAAATIRLDIGGTSAGSFGRINVSTLATINGTLDLRLVDGFVPTPATVFTVFSYGSRSGTFTTISDNDPAHIFNPTYNATNFTLTVA